MRCARCGSFIDVMESLYLMSYCPACFVASQRNDPGSHQEVGLATDVSAPI